jgi:hypothetical protein
MSRDDPDWKEVFASMRIDRSPTKAIRPRRKKIKSEPLDCFTTPEERRAEIKDKKHELFVADMERTNRWDILDDPEIASYAFEEWLKTQERRAQERKTPRLSLTVGTTVFRRV